MTSARICNNKNFFFIIYKYTNKKLRLILIKNFDLKINTYSYANVLSNYVNNNILMNNKIVIFFTVIGVSSYIKKT